MSKYCHRNDANCFTNLPLTTVISEWFVQNVDAPSWDIATIIFTVILLLFIWIVIKISFRMIKSMIKPIIFIIVAMILWYTKQFTHYKDFGEFIVNAIEIAITLVVRIFETAFKILGIEQ